jgi:hypothetical protein
MVPPDLSGLSLDLLAQTLNEPSVAHVLADRATVDVSDRPGHARSLWRAGERLATITRARAP